MADKLMAMISKATAHAKIVIVKEFLNETPIILVQAVIVSTCRYNTYKIDLSYSERT